MRLMPIVPEWERITATGPVGVDREKRVLRGYVVAQLGPFKSAGRGEFDKLSLEKIVELMAAKPVGVKSRFAHPSESNDGLGKFLGRSKNPRLDGNLVRADLHLDPTSFDTPSGNLGGYVLDLAESDPDALSSSLVLKVAKEYRMKQDGSRSVRELDANGDPLPPLWRPTQIHASDVVETGDAVDAILSAGVDVDGLPQAALWHGTDLLDSVFAGQPRDVVEARCRAWLDRYLSARFEGDEAAEQVRQLAHLDALRRRLELKGKV